MRGGIVGGGRCRGIGGRPIIRGQYRHRRDLSGLQIGWQRRENRAIVGQQFHLRPRCIQMALIGLEIVQRIFHRHEQLPRLIGLRPDISLHLVGFQNILQQRLRIGQVLYRILLRCIELLGQIRRGELGRHGQTGLLE